MKTITAAEFEARCLAMLDEVAETGEVLTILKHGQPVAQIVPPGPYPQLALAGTVQFLGDVIDPVVMPEEWEAESR